MAIFLILAGDEDGPLEQFSFLRTSDCHLLEEVEEQIEKLTEYGTLDEDDYLIRGLRRGIGIHHSGLSTKYRKAVEVLFRAKYLRLVVATGDAPLHDHHVLHLLFSLKETPSCLCLCFRLAMLHVGLTRAGSFVLWLSHTMKPSSCDALAEVILLSVQAHWRMASTCPAGLSSLLATMYSLIPCNIAK